MAGRAELAIEIRARDAASRVLRTIERGFVQFGRRVTRSLRFVTRQLFSLRALLAGLGATLLFRDIIRTTSAWEDFETQLISITGSATKARKVFEDIKDFAATTPFQIEELVEAGAQLEIFGVGGVDNLRKVGDASASMRRQIIDVVAEAIKGLEDRLRSEFGKKPEEEGEKPNKPEGEMKKGPVTLSEEDLACADRYVDFYVENFCGGDKESVDEESLSLLGQVRAFQAKHNIETFDEAYQRFSALNPWTRQPAKDEEDEPPVDESMKKRQELVDKVHAFAEEKKLSFNEAWNIYSQENPKEVKQSA